MVNYNYLKNYSFEADENRTVIPTDWILNRIIEADELYVEDKQTDSLSGNRHYHFWSKNKDSIEFELEQEVNDLKAGDYAFSISIMGGDAGETEIYAYIKKNDQIVQKAPMKITSYNNWDTGKIDFEYNGDDNLKVGIYVRCAGEGSGAWGKIDDALLNRIGE